MTAPATAATSRSKVLAAQGDRIGTRSREANVEGVVEPGGNGNDDVVARPSRGRSASCIAPMAPGVRTMS